ncbi:uncharacterized protein E0L32_008770 [Thyridium curvatum]|uniref:Uncharacterized protein n=1 Tax=Thyridium curvatum TaxID=1093900 RepID=A0A507AJA6_9PEZI|nr:uncharacterized protein E0L32_008770 [Thyridium curvatum]TPX10365.1 hypothetical protein E0L32_008770 [Thyridium curvatum]
MSKRPHTKDDDDDDTLLAKRLKPDYDLARHIPSINSDMEPDLRNKATADEETIDPSMSVEDRSNNDTSVDGSSEDSCDETDSDSDSESSISSDEEPINAHGENPILPFDREYMDPKDCRDQWEMSLRDYQEQEEQDLDETDEIELAESEWVIRAERKSLLKQLSLTTSVPGLDKMITLQLNEDGGNKAIYQQQEIPENDSDSDDSDSDDFKDWSKPDAMGWKSAADGSRLMPEAIELILDFFEDRQHVTRAECEEYCLKAYLKASVGPDKSQKWPLSVRAYPSESQFRNSYMVEVIDATITDPTLMTQFYISPERLDESQLSRAKEAYGNFIPEYTYVGDMGLAANRLEELFVWRIVSPVGRPFAANSSQIGLRVNQDKYLGILKQFVDFVCHPLQPAGGGCLADEQGWPMVLHNPLLDAYNIIIRPDWSGIACVLLWGAPPAVTLPFGASLSGLLCLCGKPEKDDETSLAQLLHWDGQYASLFEGYSREAREIQRFCLYYLREKERALANDPKPWHRLFDALAEGISSRTDMDEPYYKCYRTELEELKWDWWHFEMDPGVPVQSAITFPETESGHGGENDDVDMDMNTD